MQDKYCFVTDAENKPLSPVKEVKAWYMIRKKKAVLVSKYPMVIRLIRTIPEEDICRDDVRCGIDDGSKHAGIALVQECRTYNKVLFKGTIEQRNDVKKKMTVRLEYRRNRRRQKRYRPARFNNRKSSKRKDRIAPSILQKRQAVIRVISWLRKWTIIRSYYLEDVAIDIRALTDGYKPYSWQYQKSDRLDENIRKAVILRDKGKCMECGKSNCILEVHHIVPRRLNGGNTLSNLITLCKRCHDKTEGHEEQFIEKYSAKVNGANISGLNYANHVMIGKTWLNNELKKLGTLELTTGGDTANKRIEWNIDKSHSNDAVCITDLKPDTTVLREWIIKPQRRKIKERKSEEVLGFRHRDIVQYTYKNGKTYTGYVKALYPELNKLSFIASDKDCNKVNARKCKLIWRPNRIYWL